MICPIVGCYLTGVHEHSVSSSISTEPPSGDELREKAIQSAETILNHLLVLRSYKAKDGISFIADALESFAREACTQVIEDVALGLKEDEVSQEIRKEALEEAAAVTEKFELDCTCCLGIAYRIRSLISKDGEQKE